MRDVTVTVIDREAAERAGLGDAACDARFARVPSADAVAALRAAGALRAVRRVAAVPEGAAGLRALAADAASERRAGLGPSGRRFYLADGGDGAYAGSLDGRTVTGLADAARAAA